MQNVSSQQDIAMHISRSVLRLKAVLLTLYKTPYSSVVRKEFHGFYRPLQNSSEHDHNYDLEYQHQSGSKLISEPAVKSMAESCVKFEQCVYGPNTLYVLLHVNTETVDSSCA